MYTDMKDGTKVFTSYKNFSKKELLSATPIYHEFNTWEGEFDFTQIKSYEEFPIEARKIIEYREVPNLRHYCVLKNGTHASKKCII